MYKNVNPNIPLFKPNPTNSFTIQSCEVIPSFSYKQDLIRTMCEDGICNYENEDCSCYSRLNLFLQVVVDHLDFYHGGPQLDKMSNYIFEAALDDVKD